MSIDWPAACWSRNRRSRPSCTCGTPWPRNWKTWARTPKSFAQLQLAQQRRRAVRITTFDRDRAIFERLLRLFAGRCRCRTLERPWRAGPIFIVGMPRTGTTLVDRMLGSHSQVASAGESQNFGLLLKRATGTTAPQGPRRADTGEIAARRPRCNRPRIPCANPACRRKAAFHRQDAAQLLLSRAWRGRCRRRASWCCDGTRSTLGSAISDSCSPLACRTTTTRWTSATLAAITCCSTGSSRTGAACCQGVSTK